jgi:hypothetical protein
MNEQKDNTLLENKQVYRQLEINYTRNKQQDCTLALEQAAKSFCYEECRNEYWQSEEFSLLYGTPLWEQSSPTQKLVLNHLYWVAYYAQIISADLLES